MRIITLGLFAFTTSGVIAQPEWPGFRGPNADGYKPDAHTPTEWDFESGENILWRTPIPGLSHSSPVIAGDRVFVTTAVRKDGESSLQVGLYGSGDSVEGEGAHEFRVYAIDRASGQIIWDTLAIEAEPRAERHTKGSHAASTPATDGEHVIAWFASEGLYCLNADDGSIKWKRDLGTLVSGPWGYKDLEWGFSSSPVLHDGRVVIQCDTKATTIETGVEGFETTDHDYNSYVAALDLETGETIWKTERGDFSSWGSPTIAQHDGVTQIICNGWYEIAGYDFNTGVRLWKTSLGGDIPVPTPITRDGLVYITNAHGPMAPIVAIDLSARGEFDLNQDSEQIIWMHERRGNYMQTPLIVGDILYTCSDSGIAAAYDRHTGELHKRERLGSGNAGFTASPVAANGHVYFTGEAGQIYIVEAKAESIDIVAVNDMPSECMATPAIAGDTIFWRTRTELIAIGSTTKRDR